MMTVESDVDAKTFTEQVARFASALRTISLAVPRRLKETSATGVTIRQSDGGSADGSYDDRLTVYPRRPGDHYAN